MTDLTVKFASIDDLQMIKTIDGEYVKEMYSESMIRDSLLDKNTITMIAYYNEYEIGYVSANIILDEATILKIVIRQKYRGKGYGKLLLKTIIHELVQKHIKNIFLEVGVNNLPAKNLYENVGFELIYKRQKYYRDGEDADIYRLSLDV